jgi:hypothetical protein
MARYGVLPAIFLIWGCGDPKPPPPSPAPTSFRIRLQPARYVSTIGAPQTWELTSGKGGRVLAEWVPTNEPRFPLPGPNGWFTLTCDGTLRYLFQEDKGELQMYVGSPLYSRPCGTLPLELKPGVAWTSGNQTALCTAIGDNFRLDFRDSGRLLHSMTFSPSEGLLRWEGIEPAPIVRVPEDMTEILLLRSAGAYSAYGRVDDDPREAVLDCEPPRQPLPRLSGSQDGSPHGRKIYYLFAKDRATYLNAKQRPQPDGQVLVKETWIPGKELRKGPLFLMLKSQGDWVYATATPDGQSLTASGRIASCVKCHESAPYDKLF